MSDFTGSVQICEVPFLMICPPCGGMICAARMVIFAFGKYYPTTTSTPLGAVYSVWVPFSSLVTDTVRMPYGVG